MLFMLHSREQILLLMIRKMFASVNARTVQGNRGRRLFSMLKSKLHCLSHFKETLPLKSSKVYHNHGGLELGMIDQGLCDLQPVGNCSQKNGGTSGKLRKSKEAIAKMHLPRMVLKRPGWMDSMYGLFR